MTHCNTSLGLLKANAPAVPSVFRNTPPADAEDESLRTAPEDWRAQSAEQKAAINQFHIAAIAEHFRKTGARVKQHAEDLPLDQRLANYIIEGTKDGLVADLDRKRAEGATPLEIINGPLMAGMSEVGRLFNNNELIVLVRTAGEKHAADGDHGDRPQGGGNCGAHPGGRRGALREIHAQQDRSRLRGSGTTMGP